MSTKAIRSNDVEADAVLAAAQRLRPLLERHAVDNELSGQLSPEIIDAFHAQRLYGLFLPKSLGGLGLSPISALKVIKTVCYADGSSGWVLFATAMTTAIAGGYLGSSAVQDLFRNGRLPAVAGQGIPNGKAIPVDGGYRLSGNWNYGSGVKHADYIHTGAIVFDGSVPRRTAEGDVEMRIFVLPREQVFFKSNWDVIGLRATGSIDYAINDVFVPKDYTHLVTAHDAHAGDIFRIGGIGLSAVGHTAFALGVGRRLLDELASFAQERVGKPGLLGESESFQEAFATSEARLRAAEAFAFEAWEDVQRQIDQGKDPSTRQITLVRLALNNATWTAADIAAFAYRSAGGTALRSGVIQRFFRDMHGGTQHITSSPAILRECGKELAGLADNKVWGLLSLVPRKDAATASEQG